MRGVNWRKIILLLKSLTRIPSVPAPTLSYNRIDDPVTTRTNLTYTILRRFCLEHLVSLEQIRCYNDHVCHILGEYRHRFV